jgi:ABC-type antimicrobial peptide transport system permease subunit
MYKNYLLITLRSMMKSKVYILINILGLAISIGSCIVAFFNYDFNRKFDDQHANADKIYRVNSIREFQNERRKFGHAPMALGNALKEAQDIDQVVRFGVPTGASFRVRDEVFGNEINYVDSAFFKVFTFEFIEGDGNLGDPSKIFISDKLAEKYFGQEKALGKTITQMLDSGRVKEFEVAGVFKEQPSNSSFGNGSAYTAFSNMFKPYGDFHENTWYYRTTIFLMINDPSRVKAVYDQMQSYIENNNKVREDFIIKEFQLQSLQGMAVADSYDDVPGTWTRDGSPLAAVIGVGMMGILILLIACFNLTNTTIAISSRRLKEIGIRKVMGSMRKHLIFQFLGETVLVCLAALLLGMALAEFVLIPAFNNLWPEMKLTASYIDNPAFLLFMIGVLLFAALIAGAYPAFYISKFQPTSILKGTLKFGGTSVFSLILQTMQFAICLVGIVSGFAFTENARYQRDFDMGFDRSGLVYTYVSDRSEFETYRNLLLSNPDITAISGSQHHLFSNYFSDPVKHDGKELEVDIMNVGDHYLSTVGLTLVEGRDFTTDSETDRKESIIITEGLARKFAMKNPIGQEIVWMDTVKLTVVGVIKDIYNHGLWDEMSPIMLRYGKKDPIGHVLVSAPVSKIVEVNKFMESTWKELFPNKLYYSRMMDEELVEANTVNNNIVKMFAFLGIVAMILSATGLFSLVSLNIIRRMKEIGVRKVLGASMINITRVINMQFLVVMLIACVLGGYGGWFLSGLLMNDIWDYYQKATLSTILVSAAVLLVASALSVGYKIYSTVRLNPSLVLRDE